MAEIAAIVSSLLGPAMELGSYVVTPIKHQFNYLCCFTSNVQNLREEAKKLNDARDRLQQQVDVAKRNTEVIFPEVETWITSAKKIQVHISRIEIDIPKVQRTFLNIKSRFSLSKKAKKTTKSIKKLQDSCMFGTVSLPAPPASIKYIPFGQIYQFESRKQIEEDIMATLRDNKVTMVGICGMGGVGKTSMAKRIMNRVREEHLFDEVVMVVVSKQVDMLKIQHEIAELLGLKLEVESISARVHKLRARLMGTRGTLMVLDDVWGTLKLEDLGIPCEKCTVLLTSRDRGCFDTMDVQKIYVMQILSKKEAWFLFKEKVGPCVNDLSLLSIAKNIVGECKGLPIALVTVGRALKDKKNISVWRDALLQLKSGNPVDMPDVIARVYNPLKLSYDSLDNQSARSLFLLCSLFPEDHNIPLEYLTFYGMGLSMFEGIRNLEEARNRAFTLVEMLKSRFLLLDGRDERHVKMHDVVRDVAIFTASKEGRVNLNSIDWSIEHSNCTWISVISKKGNDLPMRLIFRNLRLLLIDNSEEIELEMDDDFFEGMKGINVLFLKTLWSRSLPQTIQLLKELRTLHLDSCTIDTISFVGELSNLEILCCRSCHWIEDLPIELGSLDKLRFLEFSDCTSLKTIKPGIISMLVRLEELKMRGSFKRWEAEEKGKERRNIALKELQFLSNLTCLEIEIGDCSLAAEKIFLSPKIAKYDIRIYGKWPKDISAHEKRMSLELRREITLGNWIHKFVRSTESLVLTGDGSNSLNLTEVQRVKSLGLSDCSSVKKLVKTTSIVFPFLESLWLCRVPNLEEICDGPIPVGSTSFGNLKELTIDCLPALLHLWKSPHQNVLLSNLRFIHIWTCNNLHHLFSLTMARGLSQLEMLDIRSCETMEEIFLNENEEDVKGHITFPKLKRLSLGDLPNLKNFCKGIERIELPRLTYMEIHKCPKFTSLACTGDKLNSHGHVDDCFTLFCNQKVAFGDLKELYIHSYENMSNIWCHQIPIDFFAGLEKLVISNCDGIRSLCSSSAAGNLVNLRELTIQSCQKMIKVISDVENACEKSPFPSLEILQLEDLLNLASICEWRCALELLSIKHVSIDDCPQMKSLTLGSLRAPNLETIKINNEVINMEDSNGDLLFIFSVNVYQLMSNVKQCDQGSTSIGKQVMKDEQEKGGIEEEEYAAMEEISSMSSDT